MNKERLIYLFIVFGSLLIYTPYIQSFDNYQDCRYFKTGDSWWYEEIVVSLIDDLDLDMSNNIPKEMQLSGQLSISDNGQLVPKHSILFPIATIPFYLIFGSIGTLYFNLALIVLLNVILYAINRCFFNRRTALITTFLFATGTIIMNYSYNYLGSVFSTVLLSAGVLYVLRKNYFLASIILGFACFAKVSNVAWVGIMFLFIFYDYAKNKVDWKQKSSIIKWGTEYLMVALIFIISLIPLFVTNYLLYGGVLKTGYHRIATLDENFNLAIEDQTEQFTQNFWEGLNNILFHPTLGMIEANPIILVSILGVFGIKRMKNSPWAVMFLVIIIAQFVIFSKWNLWFATEFGNRFLMFSIVLFSIFTSKVIDWVSDRFYNSAD